MYKNAELIENSIDAIYHVAFQIDMLGDPEVDAEWYELLADRDVAQIAADLGELPEEMIVEELYVLFYRVVHSNSIGWRLDHIIFQAGCQKYYAALRALVDKGEFE